MGTSWTWARAVDDCTAAATARSVTASSRSGRRSTIVPVSVPSTRSASRSQPGSPADAASTTVNLVAAELRWCTARISASLPTPDSPSSTTQAPPDHN